MTCAVQILYFGEDLGEATPEAYGYRS